VKITQFFEPATNGDSALFTAALEDADLPEGFFHFSLMTDANGQLSIDQVPPGFIVWLNVNEPPFAEQRWGWMSNLPNEAANPKPPGDVVLAAGKIINGRVVAADTGLPLAKAGLRAHEQSSRWVFNTESDAQGRFQFNVPLGATFDIEVYAPIGTPYLGHKQRINPGDDLAPEVRIELPRGVPVHGKVVEQFTGRPVPFAGIRYLAHFDNANAKEIEWQEAVYPLTTADETGSFVLGIPPGQGNLLVNCTSADFVLHKFSKELLLGNAVADLTSQSAFANQPLDVPLSADEVSVELSIERGVTVQGNVVGADGTIPQQIDIYCLSAAGLRTDATTSINRSWPNFNGHLKIRGIPASGKVLAFLFDRAGHQGKSLQLKGSDAERPYNVRLDKCANATLRFLDVHDDPVPGYMPMGSISLLWLPGDVLAGNTSSEDLVAPEITRQSEIDNASRKLVSDETGRVIIPNLIPGAIYKLDLPPTEGVPREIKLRPGENLELPPIVISDANAVGRAREIWKAKQAAEANQK
jgi:hypothetical protein